MTAAGVLGSGNGCAVLMLWLARQLDASFNVPTVCDDDDGGTNLANQLCALADIYLVHGFYLAVDRTKDFNLSDLDVGPDLPMRGNREAMLDHIDRSLHFALDGQVLLASN